MRMRVISGNWALNWLNTLAKAGITIQLMTPMAAVRAITTNIG
jgi:hypothetical protein